MHFNVFFHVVKDTIDLCISFWFLSFIKSFTIRASHYAIVREFKSSNTPLEKIYRIRWEEMNTFSPIMQVVFFPYHT